MFSNKKNSYVNIQVQSDIENSNKVELVVLVYGKIVEMINLAIFSIKINKVEEKIKAINKSLELIEVGLVAYLDMDQGEIAYNLKNFYTSSMIGLLNANAKNNIKELQEIADNFNELKKSWKEISYING